MRKARTALSPISCPVCHAIFKPRSYTTKYCSKQCQIDARTHVKGAVPPVTKRCSHCKAERPAGDFGKSLKSPSGLQSWCKECQSTKRRPTATAEYTCEDCGATLSQIVRRGKKAEKRVRCPACVRRQVMQDHGGHTANYTGTQFFPGKHIAMWKHSAKRRHHDWDLTNDDLDEIYREQQGLCALSGIQMNPAISSPYRPSIDRIDSTKGYTRANVQFVCSVVNVMKNKIHEPLFVDLCAKIATHRSP